MNGASGAKPDLRGRRRWGRQVRPVIVAVGLGSIAAYAAVSATVNAQPATPRFNGWVAVLQPAGSPSGDQVELMILAGVPGAPGSHPELGYMVAVCGDHPFDGVLIAGGDARLRHVRVVAGATSPRPSVVDVPDLTLVQAGPVPQGPAQVLHLSFTDIPSCTAPFASSPPYPEFTGAAEMESGLAMAPVRSDSGVLWWTGPRSSQDWPLVGTFPGFPAGDAGVFTGAAGLSGEWSRPIPEYVRVEAGGLAARASVDEAQPQPESTTGLHWRGVLPLQPTARVTDVDAMSGWQQSQVAAGIGLGIGGSLLAAWLFELRRPAASSEPAGDGPQADRDRRNAHPPQAKAASPGLILLLIAAILVARSRGRPR